MKIKWLTMPIPDRGATFAFKATITSAEFDKIRWEEHPELAYFMVDDHGHPVFLIGHVNATDHIATYVPETQTLYTSTREAFR